MKLPTALLFIVLASPALAQDERERIHEQRSAAEARYAAEEHECQQRFLVTACVDAAQTERRTVLADLRKRELVLDKAERRQKGAARTEEIRAKADAASAPPAPRASEPLPSRVSPSEPAQFRQRKPVPPPLTAEEVAANKARYEQRQLEADQHRAEVERRNRERAAQNKKPSQPLPVPPPGSAP